jgi:small subunit ribosomal protein S9
MSQVAQYHGTGKRKTSFARVILRPGDSTTWINGRSIEDYFPRPGHCTMVTAPFKVSNAEGSYDLRMRVHGGGPSGAVRYGIARALVEVDPSLRLPLKRAGFLTRDARIVERKKAWPAQGAQGAAVQQALRPSQSTSRTTRRPSGVTSRRRAPG